MNIEDKIIDAITRKRARNIRNRSIYIQMDINLITECREEIRRLNQELSEQCELAKIYAHKAKEYYAQYEHAVQDINVLRSVLVKVYGQTEYADDYQKYGLIQIADYERLYELGDAINKARRDFFDAGK